MAIVSVGDRIVNECTDDDLGAGYGSAMTLTAPMVGAMLRSIV